MLLSSSHLLAGLPCLLRLSSLLRLHSCHVCSLQSVFLPWSFLMAKRLFGKRFCASKKRDALSAPIVFATVQCCLSPRHFQMVPTSHVHHKVVRARLLADGNNCDSIRHVHTHANTLSSRALDTRRACKKAQLR